ncbi:MAG: hypothetical protein EOM19_01870 [Candidatus Moranbacteria bacterium]|nr:hypothetical protein [Candidatus Moranbacteria bacterium]
MEKEPIVLENTSPEEIGKQENENKGKEIKLRLSFRDLLRNVWKRFLERWELFFIIGLAMSVSEIILLSRDFGVFGESGFFNSLFFIIFFLLSIVLTILSQIVFFYMVVEQKTFSNITEINVLYRKALSDVLPFLWIGFLTSMVIVGMTFLFVIPGLLFVFLLGLSSMIYFCEHKKGMEALLGSWHYVSRFFWGFVLRMTGGLFLMLLFLFVFVGLVDLFFGIDLGKKIEEKTTLSFFGYSINSFLQNGIFVPLSLLFLHEIYKDMKSLFGEKETQKERIKRKRWLYLGLSLAPLGIFLLLSLIIFVIMASGFFG